MVVYGIDFGTCYSCIALAKENGDIDILPTRQNNRSLPSVVEFRLRKNGTPRVGTTAKNAISPLSRNVAAFLKTEMDHDLSLREYEVLPGQMRRISPIEFAACVYKELYGYANTQQKNEGNETSRQAVITVPAACSELQREKTKLAAEKAGLQVLKVINEPTAAAISYNTGIGETVMVFDLGGGTHDVSIVQRTSDTDYQVLASEGDPQLGGKQWDERLVQIAWQTAGIPFTSETPSHPRLIEFEKHKINLCSGDDITVTFVDDTGIQHQVDIDRETFEQFTEDLVEKAVNVAREAVRKARGNNSSLHIDRICLAGGSCRMRAIEQALMQAFPQTPVRLTNPDNAIAIGAARYALSLVQEGNRYDLRVAERGHAYGLKTIRTDGQYVIENFIRLNDPLEMASRVIRKYMPATSDQWGLTIYENTDTRDAFPFRNQSSFFRANLSFERQLTVGSPLDLSFQRDTNGIVHITISAGGRQYDFDFATTAGSVSDATLQQVDELMQLMQTEYKYFEG